MLAGTARAQTPPSPGAGAGAAVGGPASAPTAARATLDAPRVYDPKLDDGTGSPATLPVTLRVAAPTAQVTVDLFVLDSSGKLVAVLLAGQSIPGAATLTGSWDGRAAASSAARVEPGAYSLELECFDGPHLVTSVAREVDIVRLGAVSVDLTPAPGGAAARRDYLFHKAGNRAGAYRVAPASATAWTIGAGSPGAKADLDDDLGVPRPSPAPWADVASPPAAVTNVSLPVLIDEGALPRVTITLGLRGVSEASGSAVAAAYPLAGVPLRVLVNDVPAAPEDVSPGDTVVADLSSALAVGVDRRDVPLAVRFEYAEGGAWHAIPGEQVAIVRVYTIVGAPHVAPSGVAGAPYLPWLAAIDLVAGWSAGAATDAGSLASVVSDGIFDTMGLRYDTTSGAPAYALGSLDDLQLDLTGLLDRSSGRSVNCSDCATLAATLANMAGADLDYAIVGWSFTVNDAHGIGLRGFTSDLFNAGVRTAFTFHAVATPDAGLTVQDACLELDGDANPQSAPHTALRPRGLGFDRYRRALTPGVPAVIWVPHHPRLR